MGKYKRREKNEVKTKVEAINRPAGEMRDYKSKRETITFATCNIKKNTIQQKRFKFRPDFSSCI